MAMIAAEADIVAIPQTFSRTPSNTANAACPETENAFGRPMRSSRAPNLLTSSRQPLARAAATRLPPVCRVIEAASTIPPRTTTHQGQGDDSRSN